MVAYSCRQLARDHLLKLKIRILVDTDLSRVICRSEFGKDLVGEKAREFDNSTNKSYCVHQCDIGEVSVNGELNYGVTISV